MAELKKFFSGTMGIVTAILILLFMSCFCCGIVPMIIGAVMGEPPPL